MANALNWFEIPVTEFERARTFYGNIFNTELQIWEMPSEMPFQMAAFPSEQPGVGGALVKGEGYNPSADGTVVYLNGGDDLQNVLSKIEPAGGQVVMPKTLINEEIGYFAMFIDSEGNKVALHSRN